MSRSRSHDLDAGDNGHVTYRVVDGGGKPEVESFRLDSESGAVVVAESLGSVQHRTFQLKILAVDHGVPARYVILRRFNDVYNVFPKKSNHLHSTVFVVLDRNENALIQLASSSSSSSSFYLPSNTTVCTFARIRF